MMPLVIRTAKREAGVPVNRVNPLCAHAVRLLYFKLGDQFITLPQQWSGKCCCYYCHGGNSLPLIPPEGQPFTLDTRV